jgi:DNA repair exonuclease SbcCD ATPase subunit
VAGIEDEIDHLENKKIFDSEILDKHKQANELEYDIGKLEGDLDDVADEISRIEQKIDEIEELEEQRESIEAELEDLRTRIDRIERRAIEEFNDKMETVLELLDYQNIDRIWVEQYEKKVRDGRRKITQSTFQLHVIRSTDSGVTYEDTVGNLSESEREVTGLVFALAGHLTHSVADEVPFLLLDSLEAIDSERIAMLVEYFEQHAKFLVVALLPEDAAPLDDSYSEVTEI